MIAVIADDLSGAAEMAGIAHSFGLKTEIHNRLQNNADADLLVINTQSRALTGDQSYQRVQKAATDLEGLNPQWIYKKTDSVLRGNIMAELKALSDTTGIKKCLLVPANPSMNRTIVNHIYRVDNQELVQTSFASDPDYPCTSSNVLQLLGEYPGFKTGYLYENQEVPEQGVFIAETADKRSLQLLAGQVNKQVLPAGAADFFTMLLKVKEQRQQQAVPLPQRDYGKTIYVCGSSHKNSSEALQKAEQEGAVLHYLTQYILDNKRRIEDWREDIVKSLHKVNTIVLAVAIDNSGSRETAQQIQEAFSKSIAKALQESPIHTLVVEGGETAQAITSVLKIDRFFPTALLGPGVVEMSTRIDNPATFVIKPGSYTWPASLWWGN